GGEGAVYRQDVDISLANSPLVELTHLTQRMCYLQQQCEILDIDYRDFNILHSFKNMKMMWLDMADKLAPLGISHHSKWSECDNFQTFSAAACRWLAAALDNVAARGNLPGDQYIKMLRGLWTGWRSTTFINTTFNKHYNYIANQTYFNIYGEYPTKVVHFLGDDSDSVTTSELASLRLSAIFARMGLDIQPSKQLISNKRSEFLRLIASSDRIQGSLIRSICNGLSSDAQSTPFYAEINQAPSLNEIIHTWIRRGAIQRNAERIRYYLLQRWCHVVTYKDKRRIIKGLPLAILRGSPESGGLGCLRYAETPVHIEPTIQPISSFKPEKVRSSINRVVRQLKMHGTDNAVRITHDVLQQHQITGVNIQRLSQDISEAILGGNLPPSVSRLVVKARSQQAEAYVAQITSKHQLTSNTVDAATVKIVDQHLSNVEQQLFSTASSLMLPAHNLGHGINTAVAIAAGAAAPATMAFSDIRISHKAGTFLPAVLKLGGDASRRFLVEPLSLLGEHIVTLFARRQISLYTPLAGMIPSTHRNVVDLCLQQVLKNWKKSGQVLPTPEQITKLYTDVGHAIIQNLPKHQLLFNSAAY
ncbi:RNA-dependent RNA polymerase, partial [viral metagenome]